MSKPSTLVSRRFYRCRLVVYCHAFSGPITVAAVAAYQLIHFRDAQERKDRLSIPFFSRLFSGALSDCPPLR
jgi:hypothetical protein